MRPLAHGVSLATRLSVPLCRFLLCNQATLPPIPRMPFRQHSSASHSSAMGEDDLLPSSSSQGGVAVGGVPAGADTTLSQDSAQKLNKSMSMEDEAARLTIEVQHEVEACSLTWTCNEPL